MLAGLLLYLGAVVLGVVENVPTSSVVVALVGIAGGFVAMLYGLRLIDRWRDLDEKLEPLVAGVDDATSEVTRRTREFNRDLEAFEAHVRAQLAARDRGELVDMAELRRQGAALREEFERVNGEVAIRIDDAEAGLAQLESLLRDAGVPSPLLRRWFRDR